MRKSCVQVVGYPVYIALGQATVSTASAQQAAHPWENYPVIPRQLHTFSVQFCTASQAQITDTLGRFSPLSTALITRPNQVNKEIHIIRQGG